MADRRSLLTRLADTEGRMTAVLDELGLTELVTSIDGLSAVGAAVALAETGNLSQFASARSVVKHAGLNPAKNTSATLTGKTQISHPPPAPAPGRAAPAPRDRAGRSRAGRHVSWPSTIRHRPRGRVGGPGCRAT
jgi:hypothetical protein